MAQVNKDAPKILSDNLFPVVGIGASAGGLDAFKEFVKAIPKNSGMAYVLVQHLHPEHESILPEILQRETSLQVHEIENNLEVAPDNIYIIPSNKILTATEGVLKLSPRPSKNEKNLPIDIFFNSLATVHQAASIGIVLSGTGNDGTAGLKKIKDNGGVTFAQSLSSAAYSAMPQHAIDAGIVDFVMEPGEMPLQLIKLQRTFNILKPSTGKPTKAQADDEENFNLLMALLRSRQGVDFNHYKQTTVRRRILRRMGILKMEKLSLYLDYIKHNKTELDLLFNDLLIPVTNFFRDTKTFNELCDNILPRLIKNKGAYNTLRLWVAGCSTGEEAYSIAMCIHESLNATGSAVKIQIFATDLSEKSIAKARLGVYVKRELEDVSANRLQQFFNKIDGSYQVKKSIRDLCIFAVHNLLKDPPFAKMDFISCRNVLIYMEPFAQKRALNNFHYALNEKGLLLLGKSETTGVLQNLYLPVGNKEKLYAKKDVPGRFMPMASERSETFMKSKDQVASANERKDDFKKNADDVLLSKYTPPGVVVNEHFEIVQFRGQTGQFLEPSPGTPSLNILKMAKDELSFEIRSALQKAKSTGLPFIKKDIPANNGKNLTTVEVVPLLQTQELHFLILFKQRDGDIEGSGTQSAGSKKRVADTTEKNYINKLEKELAQTREDMRTVTEDQEAANEELQSANEELLSGSEELQSLNEELETSAEELQSTNEELNTVNQELFDRNDQLNTARLYAEAIVNTINEPVVILERDFKVKSANLSFYKTFQITEGETIGKTLFDLQQNGWNIPGLRKRLSDIYAHNEKMTDWEVTFSFPPSRRLIFHLNAQPLQKENGEQWLLLALHDITAKREIDQLNKRYADNLKKILENLPQLTYTAAIDGSITYFNSAFLDYTGLTFEQSIGTGWEMMIELTQLPEV
ncbi:MAG TPA: CheR family methyltransferase, partial [Hanamia sp.]|nr:CheR family methyltransferase [Hanamia sp.]